MSKNYMPEVAKMLGLEINEEFDLIYETGQKSDWGPYKITSDGLVDESGSWTLNETAILNLLKGNYSLQKRPWRPKKGELFWTINGKGNVEKYHFLNDMCDLALLNMGNCFPTKKAAKAAVPEMLAKFEEIKKGVRE